MSAGTRAQETVLNQNKMADKKEIDIYGLAYGGYGVGKIDGKVCFVEGALPGEKVNFSIKENKKNFMTGITADILVSSSDRIKPICSYYGECGGCQYQHLSYEKELISKSQQVVELMQRIGGIKDFECKDIVSSNSCYGYRASITLHRSENAYGYFSKDNKTILGIDSCPLAVQEINRKIPTLFNISKKKNITIKSSVSGNVYISNQPGGRFYTDRLLNADITFSPLAFSQTNPHIASSMATWLCESVKQACDKGKLFDLFCGVGFFGILLRGLFDTVVGIDNSSIAIDCAVQTKKSLNAENIKFYCADVDKYFPANYEKMGKCSSVILVDPPRSGLNRVLAEYLADIKNAHSLYYVSCDPSTLARDARIITKKSNWQLARLACFDMFARTKHIETIAVFKRQG